LLASDWYAARLQAKQTMDVELWARHVKTLEAFVADAANAPTVAGLGLAARLAAARAEAARVSTPDYLAALRGTLGRQPL
jgi:phosphoenolpyruvate carboxykinase (diphosphate)